MHTTAFDYVARFGTIEPISVIEIGSKNLNGTARDHFPAASWIGIDQLPGPCVDIVCNALDFTPDMQCDLVICCEVFEHTPDWRRIIERSAEWLVPGGRMIITCAGIGREIHSAIDGGFVLHFGEWYGNISERQLSEAMQFAGLTAIEVSGNADAGDTYGTALKA